MTNPEPEIDMWCLTCDRCGQRHQSTTLSAMIEHYKADHADVDIDTLADDEIVTVFERRLKAVAT